MYSTPSARPHINIFFGGTVKSRGSPLWRGLAILPPELGLEVFERESSVSGRFYALLIVKVIAII